MPWALSPLLTNRYETSCISIGLQNSSPIQLWAQEVQFGSIKTAKYLVENRALVFHENKMESNLEESLEQIKNASNRIRKYLHETPVMTSSSLNKETGLELFFKAENLQKTGSFKARGATNAVTSGIQNVSLNNNILHRIVLAIHRGGQKNVSGFVTGSSGNHGLALSWICSQLEHPVTCSVVVIKECPQNKIDAIERHVFTLFCLNVFNCFYNQVWRKNCDLWRDKR